MRTREQFIPNQQQSRQAVSPVRESAGIPNSAMLARMESSTVFPEELESLSGVERHPDSSLSQAIEARLGVRMPGMRIFEDEGLRELYGQRAYARGNEIHVARGEYAPHSQSGMDLLMHEASHILQQGSGIARGSGVLESPSLEAMAHSDMVAPSNFIMPTAATGNPIQGWNPFKKIRDKHNQAIDDFNNNREDYDNMSGWNRFLWTLKNPLARMRASSRTRDTATRNEEKATKRGEAQRKFYNADLGDAGYDASLDDYYGWGGAGEEQYLNDLDRAKRYTDPGKQGKTGLLNLGVLMGSNMLMKKVGPTGARALGGASGAVGMLAGGVGIYTGAKNASYAASTGNKAEAAASGLGAVGGFVTGAASTMKLLANIGGTAADIASVTSQVVPMGTAIAGGLQTVSGSIRGISGAHAWRKMRGRMKKKLNGRREADLSESDRRLYRTMKQAKEMAAVRGVEGAMETTAGAMTLTGSALTLSGVGGMAGMGLMLGGVGMGIAKGAVGKKMHNTRVNRVVEEELGIKSKASQLVRDGVAKNAEEGEKLVLQSMGFASGTSKEAFQHITMRRAMELHRAASVGNAEAEAVISDMGLYKTKDGDFSLQAIAEKLGMATGIPWEKQMAAVQEQVAAARNPFAKKTRRRPEDELIVQIH